NGQVYYVTGLAASKTGSNVADSGTVEVTGTAKVMDAAGNDVTGQFNVNVVPGEFTIAPAPFNIAITGATDSKTYNSREQAVEGYTLGSMPDGIVVALKADAHARAAGTDVGTYPMGLTADSFNVESANYQVTLNVVDGWLKINPAELVIKADDGGKTYGKPDGELTTTITGLQGDDTFTGSYDVNRAPGESAGSYDITVDNVVFGNPNYTVKTEPGTFVVASADTVNIIVGNTTKPYDGQPLVPGESTIVGLQPGDTVEFEYGGSQTDAGTGEGTVTNVVIRNEAGENVTGNYAGIEIVPGSLTVTPKAVTIVVNNASKIAGTADPVFTGTVAGLVAEGDLGAIVYSRTNTASNGEGTYAEVLAAGFTANKNYTVTVVPGTFVITAAPVVPVAPLNPPTPVAPTPPPTPGAVPEGPLAPVINALQDIAETVIAPIATPLTGPDEETIGDDETPLAGYDVVNCWVHYYLIIGIIITLLYGAGVLVRRVRFTSKLKGFENDVLGIEDESTVPLVAPTTTEGKEA
ncbi:MAG: MBG domain-containing protein, partial [Gordonibacter sp.]